MPAIRSCSSTTTCSRPPGGCRRSLTVCASTPITTSSAARFVPTSTVAGRARAVARSHRSRRSTSATTTVTPSSYGARTWRFAGARWARRPVRRVDSRPRRGGGLGAPLSLARGGGSATWPAPGSTIAARCRCDTATSVRRRVRAWPERPPLRLPQGSRAVGRARAGDARPIGGTCSGGAARTASCRSRAHRPVRDPVAAAAAGAPRPRRCRRGGGRPRPSERRLPVGHVRPGVGDPRDVASDRRRLACDVAALVTLQPLARPAGGPQRGRGDGCWRSRSSATTCRTCWPRPAPSCCPPATRSISSRRRSAAAASSRTSICCWTRTPLDGFDWLLVVDDDVALPRGFLDAFVFLAERFDLAMAQPAHRWRSHAAWNVTRRRPFSLVRETAFVEIGPLCALRADTFETLLPFPPLRFGWGLDAHWSALARARGWRQGVIDATPIQHGLRRIASSYDPADAIDESRRVPGRPSVHAGGRGQPHARHPPQLVMKVAIVAEYYPRAADPTLGIWAHHQARAARDAGAEVRVIVLHRPVPPLASVRGLRPARRATRSRRPARDVTAVDRDARRDLGPVPALSVPAAWPLRMPAGGRGPHPCSAERCAGCARAFPFDLIHAHYAVPAGDAVRRAAPHVPLVVSVHGGDVLGAHADAPAVARDVRPRAAGARQQRRHRPALPRPRSARGARSCTSAPTRPRRPRRPRRSPTLVTVANLIERKRDRGRDPGGGAAGRAVAAAAPRRRRGRSRAGRAGGAGDVAGRRRPRHVPGPAGPAGRGRSRPSGAHCSCCRASTRRSASRTWRRWRPGCRRSAAAARTVPRRSRPRAAASSW